MIPPRDDPVWKKIVLSDIQYNFRFLALRILMSRIKMKLEFSDADNAVDECVRELHDLACQYPEFVEPEIKSLARVYRAPP
jgi:hypothetical protein